MHNKKVVATKEFRENLARRAVFDFTNYDELETVRKKAQVEHERLLAEKNVLTSTTKKSDSDFEEKRLHVSLLNEKIQDLDILVQKNKKAQDDFLACLPNLLDAAVPPGLDEKDNQVVFQTKQPEIDPDALDHTEIGALFGMNSELAVQLSGSRFTVLSGISAKLHRALAQMMLDMHVDRGYTEVNVPLIVNEKTMRGTGQLPKFEDDLFSVGPDRYLIPTSEVPLTNLVAGQVCQSLPLKFVAHTPCFRKEAGAAGRDTKGMLRQHQFEKVELVRIEEAGASNKAHEEMLKDACSLLEALELPYRVVLLCAGDTGFSAQKTYDIEVWLPSQNAYREISSVSNCGDFQARRMNTKDKNKNLVHTLNGSGVAVGRAFVALLENHFKNNTLYIPEKLRSYVGVSEISVNNRVQVVPFKK